MFEQAPDPAWLMAERKRKVNAESRLRILTVVNEGLQLSLVAAATAGLLTPVQMTIYKDMVKWMIEMRAASRRLPGDGATDYLADIAWPVVPKGVAGLVAVF